MQSTDYLVWNFDPNAFTIGPFTLPIPIAIWGLLAAFVIIWIGYPRLPVKEYPDKQKDPEPAGWLVLLLIIGAFVAGQLIFLVLPSPAFQHIERPVRWYGIMWACAFLFGYLIMQKMYEHAGRTPEELDKLFMYVIIATVIGVRLGHIIFYAPLYYLRHPGEILAIYQAAPAKAKSFNKFVRWGLIAPNPPDALTRAGKWIEKTKISSIIPSSTQARRTCTLIIMAIAANIWAAPTKQTKKTAAP